ncbi:uncharacterized protein Ecym_7250 [Eremothecium cymbalariae DBVPG|uniref:Amine oxidase n=1 Tax=Eremothecium cymbalariae (strain CBS 270.75 / DBVPG 7215 / KCTC 17166 / NRRL Y-17582) TaxID=931890 RepID=G8JW79_ERECY|nr:hypothetical protein Ecym_7250 [Eremothecium cymbalariae DBVPG\
MTQHIYDPITDEEIELTSKLIKELNGDAKITFSQIDRLEPPKKQAIEYLNVERYGGGPLPFVPRRTYCYYYKNKTVPLYKAIVNISEKRVVSNDSAGEGVVGPVSPENIQEMHRLIMDHPLVKREIEKLQLHKLAYDHPRLGKLRYKVVCEPWIYGTDSGDSRVPMCQGYMYISLDHVDANQYSAPLKFSPVFELLSGKFVRIDYLASGVDERYIKETLPYNPLPLVEYHPNVMENQQTREGLKPLIISQPEGVSFTVTGTKVTWQGWEFRVVSSVREGVVLYDVHFKGRSLFYRVALNEMTVPYADGRTPVHRKQAFDLGDCGFGNAANSLALGCHCLGVIKYLDGRRADVNGNPVLIPSTICMHEQDYGVMFLHKNTMTKSSVVTRRREFIIQLVATVANYEYVLNYIFDQAGAITVQVRATGILSTTPQDLNTTVDFSTNVAPGVGAPFHQHILSFRFDSRLDGDKNSVVYDDYVPMEPGTEMNPYGVGFVQKRTYLEKSGAIDQSPFTNRTYKVINESSINPVSMKPVGYKFEMPARQMLLAHPESFNTKRATFATKQFWVTKYGDDQLYAAGEFTNQSRKDTGLSEWADGKDSVRNTNVVVWPTLALTHAPTTEQFPVMVSDFMQFLVAPASFFTENPALDVPQAQNNFNKSAYYEQYTSDGAAEPAASSDACQCKSNM